MRIFLAILIFSSTAISASAQSFYPIGSLQRINYIAQENRRKIDEHKRFDKKVPLEQQDVVIHWIKRVLVHSSWKKTGMPTAYVDLVFNESPPRYDMAAHKLLYTPRDPIDIHDRYFETDHFYVEGAKFFIKYEAMLTHIHQEYGVDPHIIAAIIGMESDYGNVKEEFAVINALYTKIIHSIEKKAKHLNYADMKNIRRKKIPWAVYDLAALLEITHKNQLHPHEIMGSYAGAFGKMQFMPYSYKHFFIDLNEDGIMLSKEDWGDVLQSVAQYLIKNGYSPAESSNFKERSKNYWSLVRYGGGSSLRARWYADIAIELRDKIMNLLDKQLVQTQT